MNKATTAHEDFRVCSKHKSDEVLELLEKFECPALYYFQDRPVVLSCGPLEERHFEPKETYADTPHILGH